MISLITLTLIIGDFSIEANVILKNANPPKLSEKNSESCGQDRL